MTEDLGQPNIYLKPPQGSLDTLLRCKIPCTEFAVYYSKEIRVNFNYGFNGHFWSLKHDMHESLKKLAEAILGK